MVRKPESAEVIAYLREHWNWCIAIGLHIIVLSFLFASFSSDTNQFTVINVQHSPTPVIQATVVKLSDILPPKPVEKPKPKPIVHKRIVHKPKPKPKPKTIVHKSVTHKRIKPHAKPRTKPIAKPKPNTEAINKLKALAASNISSTAAAKKARAEQAQQAHTLREKYIGLIQQVVRSNWINQDDLSNLQVTLLLNLSRTGVVQSVSVVKSSGNTAFDRQVELAVQKSSPLPMPMSSPLP